MALLSFTAMLFTYHVSEKIYQFLHQDILLSLMDTVFPVSLILISSDITFLGDLKITSSVLSTLLALNQNYSH